ncbi:hypothetical protein Gotri_004808 [Gossypium trilobum]|uniref:DC1 domain-containing protein n=1 Tax=Gossypium trilobum TaxID=34281 RepID=A0A7J9F864_9ROSI|nr:hypothetical protein [Gossypium trilobum]
MDSEEPVDLREIVTATWIKHSWHQHILTLSGDIQDFKQCDGCLLPIVTSYYCCSQCDFFLHKTCAELPVKKHVWFHYCQRLLKLTSGCIFQCDICGYLTSGFAYICDKCRESYCLRCSLISDMSRSQGHEHRLYPFLSEHADQLNTDLRYILSHLLIMMIMTIIQKVIIAIFVRKKGTQNTGSTIVQFVTLQLIPNVFSENTHLSSPGPFTQIIHILSLVSKEFNIIQNAKSVVSFALICPLNVRQLDAVILFIGSVNGAKGVCI